MAVTWSDEVEEILAGELAAGFAYLTPAKGVVINPMAPLGIRDRQAGTVTLSSSLGLWKKLQRVKQNPGVAVAYHARDHARSDRPEYVLVQGRATVQNEPDRQWLEEIDPAWEKFLGPRRTGLVGRMLNTYHWERVAIEITVERVTVFPNLDATGEPALFGNPPAVAPAPQKEPGNGTGPRVGSGKLAGHINHLPHTLLGWCGSDGMPELVPVLAAQADSDGVTLEVPPGSVPEGGRRAGVTAHEFQPRMVGQEQRVYTGWLTHEAGGPVRYAPHTKGGYRLPASNLAFILGSASLATRMGAARKAGVAK